MMNEAKRKVLQELGGIPEEVYDELVRDLFAQMDDLIVKLESALGTADYKTIGDISHSIKGSSANLRIHPVYELARSIELAAKEKKTAEEIEKNLKMLEQVCAERGGTV